MNQSHSAWELYANCDPEVDRSKMSTFKKAFSRDTVDLHFLGAWYAISATCEHTYQDLT